MPGAWRVGVAMAGVCGALLLGCRGGGSASLDAGWAGTPWTGALPGGQSRPDSLARADSTSGNAVSPIEASTERLAARTRVSPAEPHSRSAEKRPPRAMHMRVGEVHAALERFKYAQARLFRLRRTYTGEPGAVDFQRPAGTIVRVVWANRWGWAALAADSLVPDEYCSVYVGSVPDAITPTAHHWGKPGAIYCDGQTDGEPIGRSVLYGSETPQQTLVRYAMTMMPTNLMQLAVSQDAYRKVQYTYARRIEPMALQYGWQPGVRVRMLFASSDGWAAEASYDLLPGRTCVVWGGTVPQRPATKSLRRMADREGVPVCDD
jgi:hypothetical protein